MRNCGRMVWRRLMVLKGRRIFIREPGTIQDPTPIVFPIGMAEQVQVVFLCVLDCQLYEPNVFLPKYDIACSFKNSQAILVSVFIFFYSSTPGIVHV